MSLEASEYEKGDSLPSLQWVSDRHGLVESDDHRLLHSKGQRAGISVYNKLSLHSSVGRWINQESDSFTFVNIITDLRA